MLLPRRRVPAALVLDAPVPLLSPSRSIGGRGSPRSSSLVSLDTLPPLTELPRRFAHRVADRAMRAMPDAADLPWWCAQLLTLCALSVLRRRTEPPSAAREAGFTLPPLVVTRSADRTLAKDRRRAVALATRRMLTLTLCRSLAASSGIKCWCRAVIERVGRMCE